MKKANISIGFLFMIIFFAFSCHPNQVDYKKELPLLIDKALNNAKLQSQRMAQELSDKPGLLPKTLNKEGKLETSNSGWWCSGFFPGILWYLYENYNEEPLKKLAHEYTMRIEKEKYNTSTHDIGFMIFCSFGNAFRITGDSTYRNTILTASESLITRYNENVGCLRSWDYANWNKQWEYPVIIDNMMNLEMLMWASKAFNKPEFMKIAETHALTTIKNHFREDNSSYHVVSYDTITGEPLLKQTAQGYNHESAWARGQAWGLYGYTMMFRESRDTTFLDQAIKIANFLVCHPNLPDDKIPYWDYDAPDIPETLRDASAAAIMCSALIELSTLVNEDLSDKLLKVAEKQLYTLCSDEYLAEAGENGNFILKHCVGHMPNKSEVDVPLTYADYYFVEALLRYKKLISGNL